MVLRAQPVVLVALALALSACPRRLPTSPGTPPDATAEAPGSPGISPGISPGQPPVSPSDAGYVGDAPFSTVDLLRRSITSATPPGLSLYDHVAPLTLGVVHTRGRLELAVPFQPGRCYVIVVAGEPAINILAASLESSEGAELDANTMYAARVTLGVSHPLCADTAGVARLTLSSPYNVTAWVAVDVRSIARERSVWGRGLR